MPEGTSPVPTLVGIFFVVLIFTGLYCASRPLPLTRGRYLDCLDEVIHNAEPSMQHTGLLWDVALAICEKYKEEDHEQGR